MNYISDKKELKFLEAGISVCEELAEDEYEKDRITFSARSPLDVNDCFTLHIWEVDIKAGSLPYMAEQVKEQLKSFVMKDEAAKLKDLFIRKHNEFSDGVVNIVIPSNKDIQSEVRKHKEFIRTIYQILISD